MIRLASNQGQAYARNVALKQAAGEFVAFLDSDDSLSDDALESAVNVFRAHGKTDAVLFRLVKFEDTSAGRVEAAYPMPAFEALDGCEAFKKSLDWQLHGIYVARRSSTSVFRLTTVAALIAMTTQRACIIMPRAR